MSMTLDWVLLIAVLALLAVFWKVSQPYRKRGVSGSKQLVTEGPNLCVAEMVKSKPLEMHNTSKVRVVHEDSFNPNMLYMQIALAFVSCIFVIYCVLATQLFCG